MEISIQGLHEIKNSIENNHDKYVNHETQRYEECASYLEVITIIETYINIISPIQKLTVDNLKISMHHSHVSMLSKYIQEYMS